MGEDATDDSTADKAEMQNRNANRHRDQAMRDREMDGSVTS
jgi:hypothetical protein